jgi:ankyrin repeat protein
MIARLVELGGSVCENSCLYAGNVEVLRIYVASGADPGYVNEAGDTPLTQAVCDERLDVVQELVDVYAAEVNDPRRYRNIFWYPLTRGKNRAIPLLLAAGASPNLKNVNGKFVLPSVLRIRRVDNVAAFKLLFDSQTLSHEHIRDLKLERRQCEEMASSSSFPGIAAEKEKRLKFLEQIARLIWEHAG